MRFSWSQHLAVAGVFEAADTAEQGTALALMGVAMLMLVQDLALQNAEIAVVVDVVDGTGCSV